VLQNISAVTSCGVQSFRFLGPFKLAGDTTTLRAASGPTAVGATVPMALQLFRDVTRRISLQVAFDERAAEFGLGRAGCLSTWECSGSVTVLVLVVLVLDRNIRPF
jgi:hypothetical protein